jgi:uncharacterized protein (TIGR02145 family)
MTKHLKHKLMILAAIVCVGAFLTSCDKVTIVIWPAIANTMEPTGISQVYATLNGQVFIDKSTKAGFEYGTTTDYGTSIYPVSNASDAAAYTNVSYLLTTLSPATTYHYRIKIESPSGVILGDDVAFTTLDYRIVFNPNLTYGSVSDIDGNTYKTIKIGTQTWMAENLKTTKYNDGTPISLVEDDRQWMTSGSASGCYSWLNNKGAKFKDTYGAFYNWRAVNSYRLCPTGWHVPNNEEWTTLSSSLGGALNLGDKMKETGGLHWINTGTKTTNESGFTALPAGYRNFSGAFLPVTYVGYWQGSEAYWWSSTVASNQTLAYYQAFYYNSSTLLLGSWRIEMGHSVRCMKDN